NYRVEYDAPSWELLLKALPKLGVEDRVNLMSDAWAFVQAARAPVSLYFGLVEKLPDSSDLAEREQIINVLGFVNGLLVGSSERERFQRYARSLLRPTFATLGWEPKPNEPSNAGRLRASLISALGHLNDSEVLAGCRERFQKYLAHPASLPPDLRAPVLAVVGDYADEKTWNKLHKLGLKTTSIEDQQNYYNALAGASDPKLEEDACDCAYGRAANEPCHLPGFASHPGQRSSRYCLGVRKSKYESVARQGRCGRCKPLCAQSVYLFLRWLAR